MSQKTSGLSKANLDPAEAKAAYRKLAARNRNHLAASKTNAAPLLATHAECLIERFGKGIYAAYFPIRSELSPLDLLARLANLGCVTALPVTPAEGQPLRFHHWAIGDRLDGGPYGTKQPPSDQPLCRPDVILAPMLAFDSAGWRLGYGGGFYDRTLAVLKGAGHCLSVIGIAYDGQKLDKIPVGPYDMPLDAVLSPTGLFTPVPSQN
ncbi:5-formyltetrahydrofolate cyclo-ligase [Alphaproteobacteria bacterium]|nr:5-formyltetrahydrofolate cyclo-ligase [Alphaproteobacteria bacterium]